jgi:protein-L-isoaspartate(D-aspartate) O-methyltransferase
MVRTPARELEIVRRAYAKQIMAAAGVPHERLTRAFASVPRERFLGPGPWPILRWSRGYERSPSDDPIYLYCDDLIGIDPCREINNGQPSFHFALMARLDPQPGEHVVHIGAGTGYYTAILAELVGAQGRITAIEYDHGLAALAAKNLGMLRNVEVVQGDGTLLDFDPADGIYVNAGVTHPLARWLDRLRDRGRMVLPMTAPRRRKPARPGPRWTGVVFLIRRRGEQFAAHRISAVAIYPCQGARNRVAEQALARALNIGGAERVRHLYRHQELPAEQCWLQGDGWCLAYAS